MFGSIDEAKRRINDLVHRFEDNEAAYRSPAYNEESTRHEFINPFFEALGWDVSNSSGAAEQYKDCIHEEGIKIDGLTKAPDLSFRFFGQRKFFVEAKKPSVSIRDDRAAAYQLRRYAWSAKLPISILTNFAEFAIYDTRVKPKEGEKASTALITYLTLDQYADRLLEIWSIFAKDSIHRGSFDRFVDDTKTRKGTKEVDDAFLTEIEGWRESLARIMALRNSLGVDAINFVVQATVDRLIFLRIAEDRGVEPYGQLRNLLDRPSVYAQLAEIYRRADAKYNSGLFDFKSDGVSLALQVDDKTLRPIIAGLYYPKSPYEFSVIPVEILGNVYERFLGKVISLTAGHHARIEDKPEVKKAGGVYYTPTHIVDEIVEKTVGILCNGKSPKDLEKLAIVDPACGSGSFLLGAYSHLLRHYLDWYMANSPAKRTKEVYLSKAGWRLTTREKKRILLTHIYGVDIDPQAVEVSKLSLLLKVMEGESEETVQQTAKLFAERALPSLENNIRCGNSLIAPQNLQNIILTEVDKKRINAFDWNADFKFVMSRGGFDVVIGNPPYVRIQIMKTWAPLEVDLYRHIYSSASEGNYDIYTAFVEKGLSVLRSSGLLGFILPHKFFNSKYGKPLRALISSGSHLREVVHFGDIQIFRDATTYTCLLFLQQKPASQARVAYVYDLAEWRNARLGADIGDVANSQIGSSDWDFVTGGASKLFQRLRDQFAPLGNVADIFVGVQTSADDVYITEMRQHHGELIRVHSAALGRDVDIEAGMMLPILSGTDVAPFGALTERQFILYPYDVSENEHATLISLTEIGKRYPKAFNYLNENRARLENREKGKFKGKDWHRFGRNQNLGIQGRVKVCVPRLVDTLHAAFDATGGHVLDNVDVGGVTLRTQFVGIHLGYVCALLNSSLLGWYFPFISAPFRGGFRSANRQFLSKLPFAIPDVQKSKDTERYATLIDLEHKLREVSVAQQTTPHERTRRERERAEMLRRVDEIVFEIYGLSTEEIAFVRGEHSAEAEVS